MKGTAIFTKNPEYRKYDILIVGAGHAGIEAAFAGARLGAATAIFTINLDSVGNLPCNPSIGGTAKGHLVCEIDALGGEMGHAADATLIQSRMLNRRKGPAVHSLRAQVDRRAYAGYMKHALEKQNGLDIVQAEAVSLRQSGDGGWLLQTHLGAEYYGKCVILATGTFLSGKIHVGNLAFSSGPDGMFAANSLTRSLTELGLPVRRFKTGTPPRVHRGSINFSGLEEQPGDEPIIPFSFDTTTRLRNTSMCYMTYTTEKTREIIRENIHLSPMYSGIIDGVGPRYCPSIEDKIMRFPDRVRHQVFLEPCGSETEEMYVQGVSTSLPESVQTEIYRSILGLENVKIMRSAYAIEYDCVDPTSLFPTLETIRHPGLYLAGQISGSSGYEEAAAQGLVAGINAARKIQGKPAFILPRSSSYIGTLIDDLVTKGCSDPYRMMTSRSEYRLLLRQDNAARRLMPLGREIGLVSAERFGRLLEQNAQIEREQKRLLDTVIKPTETVNALLEKYGSTNIVSGIRLIDLIRRPELSYDALAEIDNDRPALDGRIFGQVETEVKYEGYIRRQEAQLTEQRRLEQKLLPEDIDYSAIDGLRTEAKEKLYKIRPLSVGQASKISGVSPADITVLLIWLQKSG